VARRVASRAGSAGGSAPRARRGGVPEAVRCPAGTRRQSLGPRWRPSSARSARALLTRDDPRHPPTPGSPIDRRGAPVAASPGP